MSIKYVLSGIIFGLGLSISGMVKPEVIMDFLLLRDPGLLLVMLSAITVSYIGFRIKNKGCELRKDVIDKKLVLGSTLFGIGWGLSGLCPGAAIASLGVGNYPVIYALISMLLGTYTYGLIQDKIT